MTDPKDIPGAPIERVRAALGDGVATSFRKRMEDFQAQTFELAGTIFVHKLAELAHPRDEDSIRRAAMESVMAMGVFVEAQSEFVAAVGAEAASEIIANKGN